MALLKAETVTRKKIDWLRYVPLAKDESPEGRDDVEHEAFARIEAAAREKIKPVTVAKPAPTLQQAVKTIDEPLFAELWHEAVRGLPPESERQQAIADADAAVKRTVRALDASEQDAERAWQAARRARDKAIVSAALILAG